MVIVVYVTQGLVDVLLDLAREADPQAVSTGLSVTLAEELDGGEGIPPETPVFTDFFMPDVGQSVTAVFGVNLSTPNRQTQGRFVSHPIDRLEVSKKDDLAQVIFIAVPPWTEASDSFGAFDRSGDRLPLEIVDAEPPERSLAEEER